jgi:hypothetical protein
VVDGQCGSGGTVAPEPVRQQLVTLASQVLGRLPAEDVPPALRAIARFTPAKRQRLGAAAVAAALDADDDFRDAVARVVTEASPQLVEAVRDGLETAASDPVDVAVVAFLTRPPGWRDILDRVGAGLQTSHPEPGATRVELAAARAELARVRAEARGEAGRLREAVAQAVAADRAELEDARRAVRDRTRDLRQAERDRDAARAAEAAVRAQLDARSAAHDAQLRRERARLADAGRAAETARRGARVERDLDDARVWLLLDTLVQAAAGLRRELPLTPPAVRPADGVAGELGGFGAGGSGGGTGGGRRVAADVMALDRLLALPHVHLVIDGYNVTKTGYGDLSLADQRTRLTGALAALAAQTGAEVTVAFDGAARPPVQPSAPRGVRVLFSAADEIADDLIRRLVAAEPPGRPVVVVTSDQQIVVDTARDSVWSVASAVLLARLT